MDYWNEIVLCVVYPDNGPTKETDFIKYKYSDELFDWFYNKLKYCGDHIYEWSPCVINEERTRRDNSANGCRIYLSDGNYIKFYENYFLMEFTNEEWKQIRDLANKDYDEVCMEDVINYFYSTPEWAL